jgi:hypothetical protein
METTDQIFAAESALDRHSIWGGCDKHWDEPFGICLGWEFNEDELFTIKSILDNLGYSQTDTLEGLA